MKDSGVRIMFLLGLLASALMPASFAQDDAAITHAKRIIELSQQEKFEEIVAEFNPQMAAAVTVDQMKQQWALLKMQFGSFKSFIDQQVTHPRQDLTVVLLGCQFEKATLDF